MSDLSYSRKYRPNLLSKVVGNTKVIETIYKLIRNNNRPQVLLLDGPSGCGKTTLARLIAKEYNCLDRDEVVGACNKCMNCTAVNDYILYGNTDNVSNITEVNIGKDSGKGDFEAILEDMRVPSFGDEWKVYILDEVHEASSALQNMLLKITEEPPEKVLMIFCTNYPEKIIAPLRNRFNVQLHVKKPELKELMGLLKAICNAEGVKFDLKGLEYIATYSDLVVRSALQNLESVVREKGSATLDDAEATFDIISNTLIVQMFRALKNKDVFTYVSTLHKIKCKKELSAFIDDLQLFITRGLYTVNGIMIDGITAKDIATFKSLFTDIGVEEIAYLLRRILAIDVRNAEIELLSLGYTGLELPKYNVVEETEEEISVIDNELAKEEQFAVSQIKEKEAVEYEKGLQNVDQYFQQVTVDDLIRLGGTLVE